MSGNIEVTKPTKEGYFYSSNITPPGNVLNDASAGINLFVIADTANVDVSGLSATISEEAKEEISSVFLINKGKLTVSENFTVSEGTVAIEIGDTATLDSIDISGDLSSLTLSISDSNTEKDKIANKVIEQTGATVSTGNETVNDKIVAINPATYEGYESLPAAISAIPDNGTVKLANNIEAMGSFTISNKTLTFDLNGYSITLSDNFPTGYPDACLFLIDTNGHMILDDSSSDKTGVIDITKEKDGTRLLGTAIAIMPNAEKASLVVKTGQILSQSFAIGGNGSKATAIETSITIEDGYFKSVGAAMYLPQNGVTTINGGTFVGGETAVEIRSGKLTIEGGSFTATSKPAGAESNNNGTTTTGAAIGIAQHTTNIPIEVTINGGEFNGCSAVYQSDPNSMGADDVTISISGGIFNATNDGTEAVYSNDKTAFITGGTFSTALNESYIASGYHAEEGDSTWTVVKD